MSKEILSGVKVLDISAVLACPMAAAFLGEFGAEVIKVEWKQGDSARTFAPKKDNISLMNKLLGRNKKTITLDFHHPEAVEIFYELVRWADVVTTNFLPKSLKKFKIDYDDLVKIKPDIIMLNLTAYGRTGPYAERPGFARVMESFAGLTYITGWPDREPSLSGNWIVDGIGGIHAAYSIMLALYHKKCTGEGQLIDIGLYEPLLRIMEDFVVGYSVNGTVKERAGNLNPGAAPNNLYTTKDGKYLVLPVNPNMWIRFCTAMGNMELAENPKFATPAARMENRLEIDGIAREWVAAHTYEELEEVLLENNVAFGPVNSVKDIFEDPHIWARESLIKVYDPELDQDIVVQNVIPKMSKTPGKIKWNGGPIGRDNDEIFIDMLKLDPKKYAEYQEKGII